MARQIRIIKFSKIVHNEYQALVEIYIKRINPILPCRLEILKDTRKEYEKLLSQWKQSPSTLKICLDIQGKRLSTESLYEVLFSSDQDSSPIKKEWHTLDVVIGGPYGLSDSIYRESDMLWRALEGLVTSDLATLIATEQLYRALSIEKKTGYHHGGETPRPN